MRPPDGRRVLLGMVGWTVGAAVRTQRSGAEYWYASRSLTRGGARSESRAWNWPKKMWKLGSTRMLEGLIAAWACPRECSHATADARQCGQVIRVWRRNSFDCRLNVSGSSVRKLCSVRSVSAPVKRAQMVSSTKYEAWIEITC